MWRAPDGARLRFAYLERDADADLYQGVGASERAGMRMSSRNSSSSAPDTGCMRNGSFEGAAVAARRSGCGGRF